MFLKPRRKTFYSTGVSRECWRPAPWIHLAWVVRSTGVALRPSLVLTALTMFSDYNNSYNKNRRSYNIYVCTRHPQCVTTLTFHFFLALWSTIKGERSNLWWVRGRDGGSHMESFESYRIKYNPKTWISLFSRLVLFFIGHHKTLTYLYSLPCDFSVFSSNQKLNKSFALSYSV